MVTYTSKRSCFRRPFGNQRVNGFQTLLKSARHHYYPIFPCIWDILSWKKSALVWSEILRLFLNTLTAHNKFSRCNVHNFAPQVQTPLSQKQKTFCEFFIPFLKCAWNLEHFEKKDEYPSPIISDIMDCEKRWLLKGLKGLASEDHAVINVLTGSKHCWNQHGTTIILFFHAFGIYWVGKSLH